ncbi:MAG TPA: Crp/Fnr family transcriptional regulator [Burkholderiales bacterium]|nr:Crp/Fnr family transcriptional regulator [Burkholderiales bacterium]
MTAKGQRSYTLSDADLTAIGSHGVARSYPKNTIIVSEGDRTDSLYVILEGRVKAFVSDGEGRDMVLSTQGPGEYFGEMVLDEGPRSASIMTLEPSRFLVVQKNDFRDFVLKNPAFALSLIDKLIHRARALTESVKSLALMDVYGRVARLLLELAEERDGSMVIPQRLTQQDMASRIGASREMVSRILKDLSSGGYLTQSRTGIVLHRKPPEHW